MVKLNKAVFLDRDGIINVERGDYTWKIENFIFVPGIIDSLKKLQDAGFLLIVISNQGGISKGLFTKEEVETLHDYMKNELQKHSVSLTEIYYCPHYPDIEKCICRKPDTLMIEKALARFSISAFDSYFLGDRPTDIETARKTGITGILVPDNQPVTDIVQSIIGANI